MTTQGIQWASPTWFDANNTIAISQPVPVHWLVAKLQSATTTPSNATPPPAATVAVGGVEVTAQQITDAILALKAHESPTQVKPTLKKIGHPLAHADLNAIRDQEVKADPSLIGPGSKKKAVLRALHRYHTGLLTPIPVPPPTTIPPPPQAAPVDALNPGEQHDPPPGDGTVHLDEHGHAVNHHREAAYHTRSSHPAPRCTAIAEAFGTGPDGTLVVGRCLRLDEDQHLDEEQQHAWVTAFLRGDLKACYDIEATTGDVHPDHPGGPGHDTTHLVTWQAAVPGETPAGVKVPGNWSAPALSYRPPQEADAYLEAAHMKYPTGLSPSARSAWVRHHILGDTEIVDGLSRGAKTYHDRVLAKGFPTHDKPDPEYPTSSADPADHTATPIDYWPVDALYAYTAAHHLPVTRDTYTAHLDVARTHQLTDFTDQVRAAVSPTYTFTAAPDTTPLPGYHRKHLLHDQHHGAWLFKPAPDPDHVFRPETEHEAHLFARRCGYRTADSQLTTHDGQYGQAQRILPVARDLTGVDVTTLTVDQQIDIAREHLLDWALDNDDCHPANIVELTDATIVGIDKGRAWRYFGGWPGLTADRHADTNCALTYTRLYDAIAEHRIDQPTTDQIYRAVHARALRMQRIPDADVAAHVARAVAHRPHYRPSSYQRVVAEAPTTAAELVTAATARKNRLAADITDLWTRVYTRAGWTPPDLHNQLGENNDGARLYSGLLDPDLPAAVQRTKSHGTPTFVAGRDIDDAHLLLWRERHHQGHWLYRGETTLAAPAATRAQAWYRERLRTDGPTVDAAVNHFFARELQRYAYHATETGLHIAVSRLRVLRQHVERSLATYTNLNPQPVNAVMCEHYLERIDFLIADIEHGDFGDTHPEVLSVRGYIPPATAPTEPVTEPWVVLQPSRRPAASLDQHPTLADDGELHLIDAALTNQIGYDTGHSGNSYWTHLPTGELVEFRPHGRTGVPRATWGMLRFTLNPDLPLTDSLTHINDHFTAIGTPLHPATHTDLELFYWRHLYAIMRDRADSAPTTGDYQPVHRRHTLVRVSELRGPDHELTAWHAAFAVLTGRTQLDDWVTAGGHLPRLLHLDLHRPDQHCGRPHWERFDVPATTWSKVPMPGCVYNSGPTPVITTGAAYSTEARIRALAIWKTGMSSASDQTHGSSNYIFLRLNREERPSATLLFSPRVLARTSTYGFNNDTYGRLDRRHAEAYFAFAKATSHTGESNECMVKHALSLLDDVEIMVVADDDDKTQIVTDLAALGITHIRGVAVQHRILTGGTDVPRRRALATVLRQAT